MVRFQNMNDLECNEFSADFVKCDYLSLRANCQECGNCPLTKFGEWFYNDKLNGAL